MKNAKIQELVNKIINLQDILIEMKESCYYPGKNKIVKRVNKKLGNLNRRKLYLERG